MFQIKTFDLPVTYNEVGNREVLEDFARTRLRSDMKKMGYEIIPSSFRVVWYESSRGVATANGLPIKGVS